MHEAAVQAAEEAPLAAAAEAADCVLVTEQQLQATQRADSCRNDGNAAFQRARFGAAEQDYSKVRCPAATICAWLGHSQ